LLLPQGRTCSWLPNVVIGVIFAGYIRRSRGLGGVLLPGWGRAVRCPRKTEPSTEEQMDRRMAAKGWCFRPYGRPRCSDRTSSKGISGPVETGKDLGHGRDGEDYEEVAKLKGRTSSYAGQPKLCLQQITRELLLLRAAKITTLSAAVPSRATYWFLIVIGFVRFKTGNFPGP